MTDEPSRGRPVLPWRAVAGLLVAAVVVAAGWWVPNASEWNQCGAGALTAATRGLFGKPSTLECLGASLDRRPSPSVDTAPSAVDDTAGECITEADPACPQPSTPPQDPSCRWVVPADRDPLWIYSDGSPC